MGTTATNRLLGYWTGGQLLVSGDFACRSSLTCQLPPLAQLDQARLAAHSPPMTERCAACLEPTTASWQASSSEALLADESGLQVIRSGSHNSWPGQQDAVCLL